VRDIDDKFSASTCESRTDEQRVRLSTTSPSEVLSREMSHDPSSVDATIPSFHFAQLCKHPARVERDIAGVDPVSNERPGYASRFPAAGKAKQ
jgi:hypothetical protein